MDLNLQQPLVFHHRLRGDPFGDNQRAYGYACKSSSLPVQNGLNVDGKALCNLGRIITLARMVFKDEEQANFFAAHVSFVLEVNGEARILNGGPIGFGAKRPMQKKITLFLSTSRQAIISEYEREVCLRMMNIFASITGLKRWEVDLLDPVAFANTFARARKYCPNSTTGPHTEELFHAALMEQSSVIEGVFIETMSKNKIDLSAVKVSAVILDMFSRFQFCWKGANTCSRKIYDADKMLNEVIATALRQCAEVSADFTVHKRFACHEFLGSGSSLQKIIEGRQIVKKLSVPSQISGRIVLLKRSPSNWVEYLHGNISAARKFWDRPEHLLIKKDDVTVVVYKSIEDELLRDRVAYRRVSELMAKQVLQSDVDNSMEEMIRENFPVLSFAMVDTDVIEVGSHARGYAKECLKILSSEHIDHPLHQDTLNGHESALGERGLANENVIVLSLKHLFKVTLEMVSESPDNVWMEEIGCNQATWDWLNLLYVYKQVVGSDFVSLENRLHELAGSNRRVEVHGKLLFHTGDWGPPDQRFKSPRNLLSEQKNAA